MQSFFSTGLVCVRPYDAIHAIVTERHSDRLRKSAMCALKPTPIAGVRAANYPVAGGVRWSVAIFRSARNPRRTGRGGRRSLCVARVTRSTRAFSKVSRKSRRIRAYVHVVTRVAETATVYRVRGVVTISRRKRTFFREKVVINHVQNEAAVRIRRDEFIRRTVGGHRFSHILLIGVRMNRPRVPTVCYNFRF